MMLLLDIEFYISLAVQPTDIKGDKFVIESLGHLLKTHERPSRLVKASGTPVTEIFRWLTNNKTMTNDYDIKRTPSKSDPTDL